MLEVRSRKRYGTAASNHASKLSVLVSTLCRYAGGAACGDSSNWWSLRDPRANIISGNGSAGVTLQDPASNDNRVMGCYIGLNAAGTAPVGNSGVGIAIVNSPSNQVGAAGSGALA